MPILKLLKIISKQNQNENEIHKISIEFFLYDNLLYYIKNNKYQLCIPFSIKKKIFQIAYNNNIHEKKTELLKEFENLFIFII